MEGRKIANFNDHEMRISIQKYHWWAIEFHHAQFSCKYMKTERDSRGPETCMYIDFRFSCLSVVSCCMPRLPSSNQYNDTAVERNAVCLGFVFNLDSIVVA